MDFTFRAIMHGISKLDKDGTSFRTIAEMTEFSVSGPMLAAVVTAMGTRTFGEDFGASFDDGLGQIVDVADSFRGIGQIITGLWHGGNLLETRVQGDNLPHFEISVNSISQLLCYSLTKSHNMLYLVIVRTVICGGVILSLNDGSITLAFRRHRRALYSLRKFGNKFIWGAKQSLYVWQGFQGYSNERLKFN